MKAQKPELLNFQSSDLFMKAVNEAEKITYIKNESIFKKDETTVEVYDTRSLFLLQVGIEWFKLNNSKCPVCFSEIDWNKK